MPRKPTGQVPMTEFVGFKVEPVDKALAEAASTKAGLSVSAFVRRAVREAAVRQFSHHGRSIDPDEA